MNLLAWMASLVVSATAFAQMSIIDDFEGASVRWKLIPSDGVVATLSKEPREGGHALRLDYDFARGMGFVVIRLETSLQVAGDFRLRYDLRGLGPANTLECKLVDATPDGAPGENVWWVNTRNMAWPTDWRSLAHRRRHFSFAWGPAGALASLSAVGAIEFAVTSSSGGRGTIWLDNLTLTNLSGVKPIATWPITWTPGARTTPQIEGIMCIPASGTPPSWEHESNAREQSVSMTFSPLIEVGSVWVEWGDEKQPAKFDVQITQDGATWSTLRTITGSTAGACRLWTPALETRGIRVVAHQDDSKPDQPSRALRLDAIRLHAPEVGDSGNAFLTEVAKASPRGKYPRYFLGDATSWTAVGIPGDADEVLVSEDGQVELSKGGCTVEPFVVVDDEVVNWAKVNRTHKLVDGWKPEPIVAWESEGRDVELAMVTCAPGSPPGTGDAHTAYTIRNSGNVGKRITLALVIRPMQVLPPWQSLNLTGGFSPIRSIEMNRDTNELGSVLKIRINGKAMLAAEGPVRSWCTSDWTGMDLGQMLITKNQDKSVAEDAQGLASGVVLYSWTLEPGQTRLASMCVPLNEGGFDAPGRDDAHVARLPTIGSAEEGWARAIEDLFKLDREFWHTALPGASIRLPNAQSILADAYRAALCHIFTSADGPALQPGSRTYERSWIRDGAITATALLATGWSEDAIAFADWYGAFQYDDGKIPCVVDTRGPDPVPEHDSHGEFIYTIATIHRFTHDRALVERHWARIEKAVEYIQKIRATRMTPEYKDSPGLNGAMYGLVPESISHEGYSAKPMHSYWDGFWTIRGLTDAAYLAGVLEKPAEASKFAALAEECRVCMYSGMKRAIAVHAITHVPGCVELGDFDATSTAIGVWPIGELGRIPEPELDATFERYWKFFEDRREGRLAWKDYTPYEIRIVSAMWKLSERDSKWATRGRALLEFFLKDQRPLGWRQWGEVVWRDPSHPGFIGDYPHTWVSAEFVNTVRNMMVMEDDGALVLAAGVAPEWLTGDGVGIDSAPTWFGKVGYTLSSSGSTITLRLTGDATPPSGFVLVIPGDRRIQSATLIDTRDSGFAGSASGAALTVSGRRVVVPRAGIVTVMLE